MPLFQQSVIAKHIESFDNKLIEEKWQLFESIFHSAEKQQNIRNSKEEQYQEGFLRDLFVNVFGYIINPEPNFNLLTEQKNITNSKKADGAIVIDGKAVAVIELKGTETTDLNKIEAQAFGYKSNQPGCNYVIVSNFEKLRFYIDNTTQQEEFNLFTLTKTQFELLYACLSWDSISKNIPMQILNESVSKEKIITNNLYKDYSEFKRALFANLVELNPQFDKLLLFKKTQKLLDRFLFIFFAEDRLLLPTNLIFRINKEWENIISQRIHVSLYDRYKMYFNDLNVGAKVTLPAFGKKTGEAITAEFEIFAYNGGLFQPDELLDQVQVEDSLLHVYTERLSNYNFESDVDVNILGHIFENSLNEIDEIKSEIEGNVLDKTKTRRKKDGVFYTPKYITKYIVENTIGKLCNEQKEALQLKDEDYITDFSTSSKTGHSKVKKKALLDKLATYRTWLLDLTICDPACGSGAFLNQALEFLIAEHRYVDELQAKLMGDSLILSDIENSILERNIYGVDLNDESVEIAKLSLWLRTAQKGRKLNSLNSNIKCGNSLIDDVAVAGEKAFKWEKEFPDVFKEKNKFAFHITTAIHDSRTSQRMIDYKARERRFEGTKPDAEVIYMTKNEEELIASTVAEIAKEDQLNIAAFNLCKDHMHILLVCEEEEVPKIMHKIKGRTARVCNVHRENIKGNSTIKGFKPLDTTERQHKDNSTPFWTQKYGCKPITSEEQFFNTVNYIEHNKVKHNLPDNIKLKKIIQPFIKTYEDCFKPQFKGGFDVVIGNPPYVRQELFSEFKPYLKSNYKCYNSIADLYTYFIEKGIDLMKENGLFSFILPNKFMKSNYGREIRTTILEKSSIELIFDFEDYPVFEDATTYPIIFIFSKREKKEKLIYSVIDSNINSLDPIETLKSSKFEVDSKSLTSENWTFLNPRVDLLNDKINSLSITLKEKVDDNIFRGVSTGCNQVFIVDELIKNKLGDFDGLQKIYTGKEVKRYKAEFQNLYLLFLPWEYDLDSNAAVKEYLLENKEILSKRPEVIQGRFNWWCLSRYGSKNSHLLTKPKIIYPRINNKCNFYIDQSGEYSLSDNNFFISSDNKGLLAFLNSSISFFFLKNNCTTLQGGYWDFRRPTVERIPVHIKLSSIENELGELADKQLKFNAQQIFNHSTFSRYLINHFSLEQLNGKLQSYYDLTFPDFIKELNKAIKTNNGTPLTKLQEMEWMEVFETKKKEALELKAEIDKTDKEIDQMVYELYGLSEEEIKIVEGS